MSQVRVWWRLVSSEGTILVALPSTQAMSSAKAVLSHHDLGIEDVEIEDLSSVESRRYRQIFKQGKDMLSASYPS